MTRASLFIRIILAIYLVFATFMVVINLIGGGSAWAQWPIWGVSMPIGLLFGGMLVRRHRLLGAWLGLSIPGILGLIAIDLFASQGRTWFFWPLAAWLVVTVLMVGLTVDLLGKVPLSQPADDSTPVSRSDLQG